MDASNVRALALATNGQHVGTVALMRSVPAGARFMALLTNAGKAAHAVADEQPCIVCGSTRAVRCCEYGRDR